MSPRDQPAASTPAEASLDGAALLTLARQGNAEAVGRLFALLYPDLRRVAHARLRGNPLLNTTALVHESFERMAGAAPLGFTDRAHFLAYAARAMRSVLVDLAREQMADRRGGGAAHVTLTTGLGERLSAEAQPELVRVHEALQDLAQIEPRLARVVEMRYYGGLANDEIAEVLGVGLRTVERDWERARSYLYAVLKSG
jgi:RNA polymerase sigma factor (TIGR02999 family)